MTNTKKRRDLLTLVCFVSLIKNVCLTVCELNDTKSVVFVANLPRKDQKE
jgi:hypothetical protein